MTANVALCLCTSAGDVPVRRVVRREVAPSAPVVIHLLVHTGMGDRIVSEGLLRHALATATRGERTVVVTYDTGDDYFVKDYEPAPHEIWTVTRRLPGELERVIAESVRDTAVRLYVGAPDLRLIDYRERSDAHQAPVITFCEIYAYYTDTVAPAGVHPRFVVARASIETARRWVTEAGLSGRRLVALHARQRPEMPEKNPSIDDLRRLCRGLETMGIARVLIPEMKRPSPALFDHVDFVCPTPLDPALQRLAGLLSLCDVLVGGDSGPAHLAAAIGTPVVSLRPPRSRWVNGPFCPPERLRTVIGSVVEAEGRPELSFDADEVLRHVITLTPGFLPPRPPTRREGLLRVAARRS
jgi:hypothetical protein